MRGLGEIGACALVMLVLHLVTPYWWWAQAVPLVYGLVRARTGWAAFGVGAASAGLVWLGGGLVMWFAGGGIVVRRVTGMFPGLPAWALLAATVLVIALAAGFAGAAGCLFRRALQRE